RLDERLPLYAVAVGPGLPWVGLVHCPHRRRGICKHLGMGFRYQRGREPHRRARDQKRDGEESRPLNGRKQETGNGKQRPATFTVSRFPFPLPSFRLGRKSHVLAPKHLLPAHCGHLRSEEERCTRMRASMRHARRSSSCWRSRPPGPRRPSPSRPSQRPSRWAHSLTPPVRHLTWAWITPGVYWTTRGTSTRSRAAFG